MGLAKVDVLGVVHGTPEADLNRPPGIQQTLFHGPAKRRAVGVPVAAEVASVQIGVRVELDHAHGLLHKSTQDGQRDEVVAPCRDRHDAVPAQFLVERLDSLQGVIQVGRIDGHVSQIGTVAIGIRRPPPNGMDTADHA